MSDAFGPTVTTTAEEVVDVFADRVKGRVCKRIVFYPPTLSLSIRQSS